MTPMYRHRQIVFTRTLETAGVDMRALAVDNIHLRRLVWTCEHCGYPTPPETYCVSQSPPDNAHRLHHQGDSGGRGSGEGGGTKPTMYVCEWFILIAYIASTCTQHLTRWFWGTRVRVCGGKNQWYTNQYTHMYVSVFNHNSHTMIITLQVGGLGGGQN